MWKYVRVNMMAALCTAAGTLLLGKPLAFRHVSNETKETRGER
jgi:hypothetical protein